MASTRENRRRRIMEKGSDRLAYITGQSISIPPSSSSSFSSLQDFSLVPSRHPSEVTANYKDDTIGNVIPKHETSNEASSNLLDVNRNERASISSSVHLSSDPAISSSIQTPSSRLVGNERQPKNVWTIFRADQISSSISASENIRLLCSAAIALLAVLSFVFPLWRSIFGRPLFLVLLTDVTIVLGLILIKEEGSSKAKAESRRAGIYGEDWSYKIGKALEVGLVLHKAISAAVIDCSVCVVLLISVLSLLRLG